MLRQIRTLTFLLFIATLMGTVASGCGDKPDLSWQRPDDKPAGCSIVCEYGYETDTEGNAVCVCKAPPDCECSEEIAPVCTTDNQTFNNSCLAECAGKTVDHAGKCETNCPVIDCTLACEHGFDVDSNNCEVCACYQCPELLCDLDCTNGFKQDSRGCDLCQCDDCNCDDNYDPVCGKNDVTYANACSAMCAGAEIAYAGACETPVECESDHDCTEGYLCMNGVCIPGSGICGDAVCSIGEMCESCPFDPDCPYCDYCPPPVCVDAYDGCSYHDINGECICWLYVYDAETGDYPVNGDGCPQGYECIQHNGEGWGYCQEIEPPPSCQEKNGICVGLYPGSECPAGYENANGAAQCSGDGAMCCLPCQCPDLYNPVCGVDGITYSNECEARCAHVDIQYYGDCNTLYCVTDSDCGTGEICVDGYCKPAGQPCGNDYCSASETCENCPVDPDCLYCAYCPASICVPAHDGCYQHDMYGDCVCWAYADMEYCPQGSRCTVIDPDSGFGYCEKPKDCQQEGGICIPVLPDAYCPDGFGPANGQAVCGSGVGTSCCLPCNCNENYDPVCGVNNITYSNRCMADCAQIDIGYSGECHQIECASDSDCPYNHFCNNGVCMQGERCWDDIVCTGMTTCENCPFDPECPFCEYCPASVCVPVNDGCAHHDMYGNCVCFPMENQIQCPDGQYCNVTDYGELGMEWGYCVAEQPMQCHDLEGFCLVSAPGSSCPAGYRAQWDEGLCSADAMCCVPDENSCSDCPRYYDPVCGTDNQTYSNECFAGCNNVEISYWGECGSLACVSDHDCPIGSLCLSGVCKAGACRSDRDCPENQLCSDNGSCVSIPCTSSSDCPSYLTCVNGMCDYQQWYACEEYYPGAFCSMPSPDGSMCPAGFFVAGDPAVEGLCGPNEFCCAPDDPTTCTCPDIWDPVCGVDGVTYANDCEAMECNRVEIAYWGECQSSAECYNDRECPTGYTCQIWPCFNPPCPGECVPGTSAIPCFSSVDCMDGFSCIDSFCADSSQCSNYNARTGKCTCSDALDWLCPDTYYCGNQTCITPDYCFGECLYGGPVY